MLKNKIKENQINKSKPFNPVSEVKNEIRNQAFELNIKTEAKKIFEEAIKGKEEDLGL